MTMILFLRVFFTILTGLAASNGQSSSVGGSTLLVQVKMGPFVNCSSMSATSNQTIGLLIKAAIVTEIKLRCRCDLEISSLRDGTFHCNKDAPYYPTYRLTISSHDQYTATQLASFMEQWVSTGPTVSDNVGTFTVDSSCTVYPDSRNDDACSEKEEGGVDFVILIGAMMTEFIVLLVVFFIVIAVILAVSSNRQRRKSIALRKINSRRRLISTQSAESCPRPGVKMHSCEAYATSL